MSSAMDQKEQDVRILLPYPKYCFKGVNPNSQIQSSQEKQTSFIEVSEFKAKRGQTLQKANQDDLANSNMTVTFKITETTHIYNAVVNTLKAAGFLLISPNSSKWNLLWTGVVKPDILRETSKYQKINHFPLSFHLGRKDLLWKNVQRMKKLFPQDYDICPETYLLPDDYRRLQMEREQDVTRSCFYILKPNASSCGKGIKVIGPGDTI